MSLSEAPSSDPVYLINPPFSAIERPNIGLGILQASARQAGFSCRTLNINLRFAEHIGLDLYYWLANTRNHLNLIGEWTFAGILFPETEATIDEYFRRFIDAYLDETFKTLMPGRDLVETLCQARQAAPRFIEEVAGKVVSTRPRVIGCTSSYQQNCAALALLQRVRQLDDTVVTLMGGANCEGPMGLGLRRAFPWVDFVVSGEAEEIFPDLLRSLFRHGRAIEEELLPECVIGASRAAAPETASYQRAMVWNLDASPPPDYDDYFEQLAGSPLAPKINPGLPLETSRGCWRQKQRCKFCGLNGDALKYRAKSADRVLGEIEAMCDRHKSRKVMFVDNNLDPRVCKEVFPRLAERHEPLCLFSMTKIVDKPQIELMTQAGGWWLTVGIESFHPRLLALMDKGSSVLQNLRLLRWAFELGQRVRYVLLRGFPGEEDDWYAEMSDFLPLIHHLEPPLSLMPIRYDRFSHYHEEARQYGLHLVPRRAYSYVYLLPAELIGDIAYYFEDENNGQGLAAELPGCKALEAQWQRWYEAFWIQKPGRQTPFLYVLPGPGNLGHLLYDTRPCAAETAVLLTEAEALILEYCDDIRTLPQIEQHCSQGNGAPDSAAAIESLLERRALIHLNGGYLSLTVKPPRQAYLAARDFPGGYYSPEVNRTPSILQV